MKKLIALLIIIPVVLYAIPAYRYKTLNPCHMLEQELVAQTRARAADVTERGRQRAEEVGVDAERIVDGIGAVIENAAEAVAERMAQEETKNMSVRECASRLLDIKFGRDE